MSLDIVIQIQLKSKVAVLRSKVTTTFKGDTFYMYV